MASNAAVAWAKYLVPKCGANRFARNAYNRYRDPGREAYTRERARRDLFKQGLLPEKCVDSWKKCRKHMNDLAAQCDEGMETYLPYVEQQLAAGVKMPSPAPEPKIDGWKYSSAWGGMLGIEAENVPSSTLPPLLSPTAAVEMDTSTNKVAIGLGIGVLLLVGGVWLAKHKKAKRAKAASARRDEED